MPHNFIFLLLSCLSVRSESNGYGLALELVMALSVGSVTILMYARIEPGIDSQECLFICVFYCVKSMQNY